MKRILTSTRPRLHRLYGVLLGAVLALSTVPVQTAAQPGSGAAWATALSATPSQATPIVYGSLTAGSIDAEGEVDSYTFTANAGDRIFVAATVTSGHLWPRIRLLAPNGAVLGDVYDMKHAEIYLRQVYLPFLLKPQTAAGATFPGGSFAAQDVGGVSGVSAASNTEGDGQRAAGGVYTIQVSDAFGLGRGSLASGYNLYLQKLNPAAGATPVGYAQTLSGNIEQPGSFGAFTFYAAAGDRILAAETATSGDLAARARVYGPDGDLLGDLEDFMDGHVEVTVTVRSTGNHTILINDGFWGTFTGDYGLYVQKLNPPSAATGVEFGRLAVGTLGLAGDMDAYTFPAAAGEKFVIAETRAPASTIYMRWLLYGPNGDLLADVFGAPGQDELFFTARDPGTHTILIDGRVAGSSYDLFVQRLVRPGNAVPLGIGVPITDTIDLPGKVDTYTFPASASDTAVITMHTHTWAMYPLLRLFGPDGALLAEARGGATDEAITQVLTSSGTYTVLCAGGFDGTRTGTYTVTRH